MNQQQKRLCQAQIEAAADEHVARLDKDSPKIPEVCPNDVLRRIKKGEIAIVVDRLQNVCGYGRDKFGSVTYYMKPNPYAEYDERVAKARSERDRVARDIRDDARDLIRTVVLGDPDNAAKLVADFEKRDYVKELKY